MNRYKRFFEEVKVGDKIKITTARTSGSKTYNVKVIKVINKSKVQGEVQEGPLVGYTIIGTPIE
jgi:sortase (surface protein transpeptidase)